MCTRHWRLLPVEVRKLWPHMCDDMRHAQAHDSSDGARAFLENRWELVRIARCVELEILA